MLFLGLIRRYWLPKTTAKIQVQSLSYFLLRKRNFHIRKLLKTFNLIFSKKNKTKKTTHRLDFCPKPLNVPLNFPLKNQSLIETMIIYCWQWKFLGFRIFLPFPRKFMSANFIKVCWPRKFMPVYCLRISHLQKFISVKCKNVAVWSNRETFCPSKYFILYNNFLWNINFASSEKLSLYLENLIANHGTRKKQNWSLIFILDLQGA